MVLYIPITKPINIPAIIPDSANIYNGALKYTKLLPTASPTI